MTDIKFEVKGKYTLISIGGMACTIKDEIVISGLVGDKYTFKIKGKRKEFYVPSGPKLQECMVFEGHDIPFKVDSETGSFVGNARFNFLTESPDELKAFLQTKCLNPSPANFHKVLYWPKRGPNAEGIPLFHQEGGADE